MTPKRTIYLLIFVLVLVIAAAIVLPKIKIAPTTTNKTSSTTQTTEPKTGTFVDGLLGDFVYFKNGGLYQVSLPSRRSVPLAGVGDSVVTAFPKVRSVWSIDGVSFAFVVDPKTITIVKFATGQLVSNINLGENLDLSQNINLSFSPDGVFLLVRDAKSLRFFETQTGKSALEVSSCSGPGVWMKQQFKYVTTCVVAQSNAIVGIDPGLKQDEVKIIASGDIYKFINGFDSKSLLVKKNDLSGTLTLDGKFAALSSKKISNTDLEGFSNLNTLLASSIERLKKTDKIDDLEVAPSGLFAIFHTVKGLWIIDLPIKSDPYFLFEGELPSIRPF